jgi:hypothetical protein
LKRFEDAGLEIEKVRADLFGLHCGGLHDSKARAMRQAHFRRSQFFHDCRAPDAQNKSPGAGLGLGVWPKVTPTTRLSH